MDLGQLNLLSCFAYLREEIVFVIVLFITRVMQESIYIKCSSFFQLHRFLGKSCYCLVFENFCALICWVMQNLKNKLWSLVHVSFLCLFEQSILSFLSVCDKIDEELSILGEVKLLITQ